jgi:hypothetical protein
MQLDTFSGESADPAQSVDTRELGMLACAPIGSDHELVSKPASACAEPPLASGQCV